MLPASSPFYQAQRDAFVDSARRQLGDLVTFSPPTAGMFCWMRVPGVEDTSDLITKEAVKHKVLMVPGRSFDPQGGASPFVRAAFSTATPEQMDTALSRFAQLLRERQRQ